MLREGHFLGLTVCGAGNDAEQSAVYECDADDDDVTDDVTDASRQFDDMMRNLGAVGLLEKFVFAARARACRFSFIHSFCQSYSFIHSVTVT